MLNAAGIQSRRNLSRNTVVRLQEAGKSNNIAEQFLFSVFNITRVSRFKIPRSVFWTMLKSIMSTAQGKMTGKCSMYIHDYKMDE